MFRLIIAGSPNARGRTAHLAHQLFDACIEDCPEDEVKILSLATLSIDPCTGCNACAKLMDEQRNEHTCTITDDMAEVYEAFDEADEVIVVAPVYFAGPCSQLKALYDRLQPYFFSNRRHEELRSATLHVIGEGHDPFGFDPLVTITQSALLCAGFELQNLFDWVGCISADGEIEADAVQYYLGPEEA